MEIGQFYEILKIGKYKYHQFISVDNHAYEKEYLRNLRYIQRANYLKLGNSITFKVQEFLNETLYKSDLSDVEITEQKIVVNLVSGAKRVFTIE